MSSDFYVYVLFRTDGSPCYVGKGCGDRWLNHERKKCENPRLARIISLSDRELPKIKIREGLSNDDACALERLFISAIGRGRKGPLVNMSDGGEGATGAKMAEETRLKISRANKGRKFTPEHRARIGEARRTFHARRKAEGNPVKLSTEHRESIRRGKVGKKMSDTARAAMSSAKKGKPVSPEAIARITAYARNKTPEHRATLAALCRARNYQRTVSNSEGF
jgi:hypothetical protein